MFYAKDKGGVSNPYLVQEKVFGQIRISWGKKDSPGFKPIEFSSADEAVKAGQAYMPTENLKARVIAEPV